MKFIPCLSDGLTDLVSDEEILAMAESQDNPEALCKDFISIALKRGGHDNTTVVTVHLSGIDRQNAGPVKKIGALLVDLLTGAHKIIKKFKP